MAGLILCKSKKARSPYCIESTGVRVYTLEELCYYLYYNIHLLGSSWINEKLLVWLNEELTLRKLAEDLEQVMKKGGSLKEMISLIMKESSYFTAVSYTHLYCVNLSLIQFKRRSFCQGSIKQKRKYC